MHRLTARFRLESRAELAVSDTSLFPDPYVRAQNRVLYPCTEIGSDELRCSTLRAGRTSLLLDSHKIPQHTTRDLRAPPNVTVPAYDALLDASAIAHSGALA